MKNYLILSMLIMVGLFTPACSSSEPSVPDNKEATGDTIPQIKPEDKTACLDLNSAESECVKNLQDFNMKFFAGLVDEHRTENVVGSPLSAAVLLSIIANGMPAEASADIYAALNCADKEILNAVSKKMLTVLPVSSPSAELCMANGMWYSNKFMLNENFKSVLKDVFQCETAARDFVSSSNALADEINAWADKATHGKINKIIEQLAPETFAVIANAFYFQALWDREFNVQNTKKDFFYGLDGKISADMMGEKALLSYAELADGSCAVRKPLGVKYACTFYLPSNGVNGMAAVRDLANSNYKLCEVDFKLPRTKVRNSSSLELNKILQDMGISSLFKTNTLGMFTSPVAGSFLIKQNATMDFTEKGAEGAAVTWTEILLSPTPGEKYENKTVHLNRPFYFTITEVSSGAMLFAGSVKTV